MISNASPIGARGIAIRAARLLDTDSGQYIERPVVVVRSMRIAEVGTNVPDDCDLVELPDHTLLPGMIDAHTHVFLNENRIQGFGEKDNLAYQILQEYRSHRVARAVRAVRIALQNGFTTIRDTGTEGAGYDDVGLRDAVAEGVIEGPSMQVAGPALTPTGTYAIRRYRPDWAFPSGINLADGPDACRKAVREQASYGINWLKVYATAGYGTELTEDGYIDSGANWTKDEFQAIVDEAHARGLRVAAHATTITGTRMAIDAGVESIEHAHTIRPEMAEQLAKKGIAIVPTLTTSIHAAKGIAGSFPALWDRIPEIQAKSFRNCAAAGVTIAFGTDAGSPTVPWTEVNQAVEFEHQVALGLSPLESIRTATTAAADVLGLKGQAGVVKRGTFADIVGVVGDPLANVEVLQRVDFVLKAGVIARTPLRTPALGSAK